MLAVGGTDNGTSENQKSWLWRHCRRRAIYWLLRSPSRKLPLNPKLKSTGAGRYQLLSCQELSTASSLAWKTSLRKVARCGIVQTTWAWRFTHDWSWWYPSGNRLVKKEHLGFTAGRWLWYCSSMGADSLIAKFKEVADKPERLMYEQSHRDYLRSGYLHHRLPVMGC